MKPCLIISTSILFSALCPIAIGQKTLPPLGDDPLIHAIERMKHTIASMDCLVVKGAQSKVVERVGSAILISEAGDFLTAAHVIQEMQKDDHPCPTLAIDFPVGGYRPEAPNEQVRWFPFKTSKCRVDSALDIAVCPLSEDVTARLRELHVLVEPAQFEWNIPPDGSPVAFTGFPLEVRDPMTFRANVAAYRILWQGDSIPELVLDHTALPGFSGSPVYLADGKIVAITVKNGTAEATGITIARPASTFRKMLPQSATK